MVALSITIAGVFSAAACLPDLSPIPEEAATITPFRGCGDGIIPGFADAADAGESCDPGPDAQVVGCNACQITCEGLVDPSSGHCYFVPGDDSDYLSAQTRCASSRAHVVTLAGAEEVAFVSKLSSDDSGYWVGLLGSAGLGVYQSDRRPEEPTFPFTPRTGPALRGPCDGCFGPGADAGVFPISDVDASDTSCIVSRGGGWVQVPCTGTTSRQTVCEREPVGVRSLDDCIIGAFCFSVP